MAQKLKKQFGNFVFVHDEKSGFVAVKAVVGFWQIRYRNDHPMFGVLLRFFDDKEMEPYFEHLFSLWYMMTQGLPDGKCLEDIVTACDEWYKRMNEGLVIDPVDKEEDDKILNDVASIDSIGELLKEEMEDGRGDA